MSTDFKIHERLLLVESSSTFYLYIDEAHDMRCLLESQTSEQIIDIAINMLQPALYNVEDPVAVKAEILKRVERLFS